MTARWTRLGWHVVLALFCVVYYYVPRLRSWNWFYSRKQKIFLNEDLFGEVRKAGWMKYSFKLVLYLCICVAAFLFSYHTHEQPHQSPDPAHSHAPVLLWISSRLQHYWLHPWHAHVGLHGSRGETSYTSWFLLCFSSLTWGYLGTRWVFF